MPSAKRGHDRITSGNIRPKKSARFGQESGADENTLANGDSDDDMWMDRDVVISATPDYQSLNFRRAIQYTKMRADQVAAWPTSLGVLKTKLVYNITPQDGPQLPEQVLQLISSRILRPGSRDGINKGQRRIPYLHLGFVPFLNLQLFVFLPNIRLVYSSQGNHDHISESVIERWTDTIFLPSIASNNPRAPASWRHANTHKHSPVWYDEDTAPFPTYTIFNSPDGHYFDNVWQLILHLSMRTPEFQHPFLFLYSGGDSPHIFHGNSPEEMMFEFERSWHQNIKMDFISSPEENLRVGFDYGNSHTIRDLPMR